MKKVLAITPLLFTGASIPRVHSLEDIKSIELRMKTSFSFQDALWCDVCLIHRCMVPDSLALAQTIKGLGKKLWIDFDDDMLNTSPDQANYFFFQKEETRNCLIHSMRIADVVTISNEAIRSSIADLNPRIEYFPCAYGDVAFENLTPPTYKKRIAWRGSTGSQNRALHHYADTLIDVANENPEWEWLFIGDNPWMIWTGFNSNIKYNIKYKVIADSLQPAEMLGHIKQFEPSILLSLHIDDRFSKCRSNMGYLDATIVGAVSLARAWPHWDCPGAYWYDQEGEFALESILPELMKDVESKEPAITESWRDALKYIRSTQVFSAVNKKQIEILESLT